MEKRLRKKNKTIVKYNGFDSRSEEHLPLSLGTFFDNYPVPRYCTQNDVITDRWHYMET